MTDALTSPSTCRRLAGTLALAALAGLLAGCGPDGPNLALNAPAPVAVAVVPGKPVAMAALDPKFAALYQPISGDKFPVPGVPKGARAAGLRAHRDRLRLEGDAGHDRHRPLCALPLFRRAKRPGDALRRRRRQGGLRLVGRGDHQDQAGMAGLVSAQGDDRTPPRAEAAARQAAERDRGCPAATAIRSARVRCTCGRATRTRIFASTARWSRTRSAPTPRPAASA